MPFLSSLNDAIVKHAPIGMLVFGSAGNCLFINQHALTVFEVSERYLKCQNLFESAWWSVLCPDAMIRKALSHGQSYPFSVSIGKKRKMFIEGSVSPLYSPSGSYLLLIFSDISANKAMETALAAAQEVAVNNLKRALIAERKTAYVAEETQRMIGQELHDDLGQHLTGLAFIAENLAHTLQRDRHPEALEAARITQALQDALQKTRLLARQLYPQSCNDETLEMRIANLLRQVESIFGVACEFRYGKLRIDNPEVSINMFRIAQEAINNAIKHSGASKIEVSLFASRDAIVLEVTDNGIGITLENDQSPAGGLGMHIMRRRSSMFGGTLKFETANTGGTRVIVTLATAADNQ